MAGQALHPASEQAGCGEGGDLLFEFGHQIARVDGGVGGDVVDRLFRIQRGALAAHVRQRVDQYAG